MFRLTNLFTYVDAETVDYLEVQFRDCILNQHIGTHRAGDKIIGISVDFDKGQLKLFTTQEAWRETGKPDEVYSLNLIVGDKQ